MHFQLGGEPPKQTWEMLLGLHLSSSPIEEQDIPRPGQEEEDRGVEGWGWGWGGLLGQDGTASSEALILGTS